MRTEFLTSATSEAQFPAAAAPEFAFLGRSNVGKSSLINALLHERTARVSSEPGRTRSINFFALFDAPSSVRPRMVFADFPGYGFAKLSKSISSNWHKFTDPYLENRPNLVAAICLVDSNIPPQPSDGRLLDVLKSLERSFLVVGTKADRLSGNARVQAQKQLTAGLGLHEAPLFCSAKTGYGIRELWADMQSRLQPAVERSAG